MPKDRVSEVSGAASATGDQGSEASKATTSTKERTKKAAGKTKEYLSEKVSHERREQAIWRLKKMVMEVQGHSECEF